MFENPLEKHGLFAGKRDMPVTYKELFDPLAADAVWLLHSWDEYKTLFGHSERRIALLNEVAPHFFGHLQRALFVLRVKSFSA